MMPDLTSAFLKANLEQMQRRRQGLSMPEAAMRLKAAAPIMTQMTLDVLPGSGTYTDVTESVAASNRALENLKQGNLLKASSEYLNSIVNAGGAVADLIPAVGTTIAISKKIAEMPRLLEALSKTGKTLSGGMDYAGLKFLDETGRADVWNKEIKTVIRPSFGENLSPESVKILNWHNRNRGLSAIHHNTKTGLSVDFSTSCPKRMDLLTGPCPYCYVEHGRVSQKLFKMHGANKAISDNPYRGEIKQWPDDLIAELNKDGGLRMFSFGDYRPKEDFDNVANLLNDAAGRGLMIKAITKQPEFVKTWGNHPNLRINISIDNVPRTISKNAPTLNQAKKLQAGRENIKIRAVALNPKEAEMFGNNPDIDVVTLYHGLTNFDPNGNRHNKLLNIIKDQNPQLVKRIGEKKLQDYTDTWVNMGPHKDMSKEIQQKYPTKVCCQGGKCSRDKTKCGFGLGALLVAGVLLPENEE